MTVLQVLPLSKSASPAIPLMQTAAYLQYESQERSEPVEATRSHSERACKEKEEGLACKVIVVGEGTQTLLLGEGAQTLSLVALIKGFCTEVAQVFAQSERSLVSESSFLDTEEEESREARAGSASFPDLHRERPGRCHPPSRTAPRPQGPRSRAPPKCARRRSETDPQSP